VLNLKFLNDNINFDDSMVSYYDELPLWSSPFGILLLNNIPLKKNSTIVDIGCGTGFPLLELAQRFGQSCKLFGIDPWEKAIERTNGKVKQYRIENVELIKGIGEKMPFPNEYVDIVVSNLGINNFENPDIVIKECFRVLKLKGKLIFTTNLFGHFDEFYSLFEDVLVELKLLGEVNKLNKHKKKRQSIRDIKEIVKNNNFLVSRIVEENYKIRFIDGSAFFNHYFIKLAFLQDWKEIIKEENREQVFYRLEERLNNIAMTNGEIILNVPMAYIEFEKQ
jgi:ubiquinone/menaquinone biosynthesis C-methylase UbiE